eukprot:6214458-Pleurochrysis_carterae.AAC.9
MGVGGGCARACSCACKGQDDKEEGRYTCIAARASRSVHGTVDFSEGGREPCGCAHIRAAKRSLGER